MFKSAFTVAVALALAGSVAAQSTAVPAEVERQAATDGIVKVRSAYPFAETIERLKADIAAKKIMFFLAVDQSQLAADAGIALKPSTLLMFGNPPLGTQFMTSSPAAGLDWPVRLLVTEDASGTVWASYTDFGWIARRHRINDRAAQFKMASDVIIAITSTIKAGEAVQ